ncbi:MAG: type IV secretion system protein [Campylobacteraceae bacterium]|jgi:hypothetical protein|nr:type IV secretion system protein [Campylobacteraceae bacterium]
MKTVKHFMAALLILIATSSSAQVAVTDPGLTMLSAGEIYDTAQQWIKEAEHWAETYKHYEAQIKEYQKQYKSITGTDGRYLAILNQLFLAINEMEHVDKLFEDIVAIVNDPELSMNNVSQAIRNELNAYNSCVVYESDKAVTEEAKQAIEKTVKACTLMFNAEYMDVTGAQELLKQIQETESKLKAAIDVLNDIKEKTDENSIKSAQDLANLISALQTRLQSQKDKLEAFRNSVQSLKTMAKNTIEQFRLLASKESAGLQNYGKKPKNSDDE